MFCMNMRCHCIKAEKLNSFRPFFVLRKYLFPFKNSVIVCKYGKLFSDSKFNENALQKKIVQYNVSYSPTKSPIHSTLHRFLSRLADLVARSLGPALFLSLTLSNGMFTRMPASNDSQPMKREKKSNVEYAIE
jgi:hypothetical protein